MYISCSSSSSTTQIAMDDKSEDMNYTHLDYVQKDGIATDFDDYTDVVSSKIEKEPNDDEKVSALSRMLLSESCSIKDKSGMQNGKASASERIQMYTEKLDILLNKRHFEGAISVDSIKLQSLLCLMIRSQTE